ncbi:MAG: prepilin-type N-terminal cleavage/methylation domain-containing protein [bacterium]|nr:prepilin-type N-terminal cleavage/methylation domain-containing protein [bacterium]
MLKKGFILIELLIVVAIIAIPNFLTAQTRTKESIMSPSRVTIANNCVRKAYIIILIIMSIQKHGVVRGFR